MPTSKKKEYLGSSKMEDFKGYFYILVILAAILAVFDSPNFFTASNSISGAQVVSFPSKDVIGVIRGGSHLQTDPQIGFECGHPINTAIVWDLHGGGVGAVFPKSHLDSVEFRVSSVFENQSSTIVTLSDNVQILVKEPEWSRWVDRTSQFDLKLKSNDPPRDVPVNCESPQSTKTYTGIQTFILTPRPGVNLEAQGVKLQFMGTNHQWLWFPQLQDDVVIHRSQSIPSEEMIAS